MQKNLSTYEAWVDTWLTTPRFAKYIKAAGNDLQRALDLYQWNTALNAVFLHDFAHFEVALRNALDKALRDFVGPSLCWVDDATMNILFAESIKTKSNGDTYDTNEWIRMEVAKTRRKTLKPDHKGVIPVFEPDKVIADLTLGCWVDMLDSRLEASLWIPVLHKAFAPGTDRKKLYKQLRNLNDFRNRVAHHEPTLRNAARIHRELYSVLNLISVEVAQHAKAHSQVQSYLQCRP